MNKISLTTISIALLLTIGGCASKNNAGHIKPTPVKSEEVNISVDITGDISEFDKELIEIAKQSEMKYNQYIELLTQMKKERKLKPTRIPRNMGKRLTFSFDGYSLLLLKKVANEAGYTVELDNIRIPDSKVVSRDYHNTMIIDIIEDIASDQNYDVEIDEKNMHMRIRLI